MRKITIIFTLLFTIGFAQPLQAQNIKILTTDWSPYVSKDMECLGFTAEVVCYAFLAVGYEVDFVFMSWDENEAHIKNGSFVASFPHKKTAEREQFALFSKPIAMSKDVFFYMKQSPQILDYKDLIDLKQYKIGGVKGHNDITMLEMAGLQINYAGTTTTSFKKMYLGLVDLVPENEFVGWQIIQKLYPEEMYKFATAPKALNQDSLHMMFSSADKNSSAILAAFDKGLTQIMQRGIYRKLLKKYIKNVEIKMPTSVY